MNINFDALLQTLPIMLYGMLGGVVVMLVLWAILALLYKVGKRGA